jgi:hypothetical protein
MGQDGEDCRVVPLGIADVLDTSLVEFTSNGVDRHPLIYEHSIYFFDALHLVGWSGNEDHSIRCDALSFAALKLLFGQSICGDEESPQSIAGNSSLFESKTCQPLLPCENLHTQLAAELSRHCSLQRLHDETWERAVVCEGLSAVMHRNACGLAEELVMRGLIRVLKSSPSAYIVNKNCAIGWSSDHILQELLESRSVLEHETPPSGIGICADDLETLGFRVLLDCGGLVLQRVLLVFS